jgi:hypothetical protein
MISKIIKSKALYALLLLFILWLLKIVQFRRILVVDKENLCVSLIFLLY